MRTWMGCVLADYGLHEAMAGRRADPDLLGACLDLFKGHPVPALRGGIGWHPAPRTTRRMAYAAHLTGATTAGSYPFRGVPMSSCSCAPRSHICGGLGCDYLCIDLDDHDGRGGMFGMVSDTMSACREEGLNPLAFTSSSGTGAHVYVFFDSTVSTAHAHALGAELARRGGARGRSDIIPSAAHATGFGTLHALPLSPSSVSRGGGLLLDDRCIPIRDQGAIVDALREAHWTRGQAPELTVKDVARGNPLVEERAIVAKPRRRDWIILDAMRRHHPQFKRALATPGDSWEGGRSARDAHLAAMMLRQGMRPLAVAQALTGRLSGTKASERGLPYAVSVVQACRPTERLVERRDLAGTKRRSVRGATPWVDRRPPPLDYGDVRNPWWDATVQDRLRASRTRARDGVVLAYLIDRWFSGRIERRQYYAGTREIGRALGFPSSTVAATVRRLMERYPDVLRVTPGVPHPRLRLATAFDVVGVGSTDKLLWYLEAGQSEAPPLCCLMEREEMNGRDCDSGNRPDSHAGNPGLARRDVGAGHEHRAARDGEPAAVGPYAVPTWLQR